MEKEIRTEEQVEVLFNQKQVAEMLKVSTKTLEYYRWKGIGPHFVKVGRHVRYRRSDLVAFIEQKIKMLEQKITNLD